MKPQNELALVVAYFFSRLDRRGYVLLGYKNFTDATRRVGEILGVKVNTIKNMRDEFDPYHQNNRIGWKRELRRSRLKVVETFQGTDDDVLLEIVKGILSGESSEEVFKDIHLLFGESAVNKSTPVSKHAFIIRGPTGKAAERFFIEYFNKNQLPITGELVDMREMGCGYDFGINNGGEKYFIEVKGLASNGGGILFTNKEWKVARDRKDKYYLVVVRNVSNSPRLSIIQNPASKLKAKRNIYTTIQVNWNVSQRVLNSEIAT